MTGPWSIFLRGRVPTKGSTEYKGHGKARPSCKWLDQWTGWACAEIVRSNPPRWPAHAPVSVQLQIAIERPASHFTTSGALGANGRKYPAPTRREDGDLDKHERAVLDMLVMAGVLTDDSQVISPGANGWMLWCSELAAEGVTITVSDCAPTISYKHFARLAGLPPFSHVIVCSPHTGPHRYRAVEQIATTKEHEVSCRQCLEIMGKR